MLKTDRDVYEDDLQHLLVLIQQAVDEGEPTWTARLCRFLNRVPENTQGIIYCGLCFDYANPRKRDRAHTQRGQLTLPGMEGSHSLHLPCPYNLNKLMKRLRRLWDLGLIWGKRERIPDVRQPRGWDYGRRWRLQ